MVGFYRLVVDFDKPIMHTCLNFCARNIGKAIEQEFIYAQKILPPIDDDAMVLEQFVVLFIIRFLFLAFHGVKVGKEMFATPPCR